MSVPQNPYSEQQGAEAGHADVELLQNQIVVSNTRAEGSTDDWENIVAYQVCPP